MLTIEDIQDAIDQSCYRKSKRIEVEERKRTGISPCWIVTSHGWGKEHYPRVRFNGERIGLHRLVKFIEGYDLAPHLTASHLCETLCDRDSIGCINPNHIVLESQKDNLARSPLKKQVWKINQMKSHARRGEKVQKH